MAEIRPFGLIHWKLAACRKVMGRFDDEAGLGLPETAIL